MTTGNSKDEPDAVQAGPGLLVLRKVNAMAPRFQLKMLDSPKTQKPNETVKQIAGHFRPELEHRMGVSFPSYNVVNFQKHHVQGDHSTQYYIKIEVDTKSYKYIYITVGVSPRGVDLINYKTSQT